MHNDIKILFNFLIKNNKISLANQVNSLLIQAAADDSMEVNLSELESLVNQEKFEFPKNDMELIGIPK